MFKVGFDKVAKKHSEREKRDSQGALLDSAIGLLPLGTTLHSALGKRPKDHSRLGEWGARVGGGIGGAMLGAVPGAIMHAKGHHHALTAVKAGSTVGGLMGEYAAAKHTRSRSKQEY